MEKLMIKLGLYLPLSIIVLAISGCKVNEPKSLRFYASPAEETTEDERISICHALQGSIEHEFSYQLDGKDVLGTYNGKPEKFCSFYGEKIVIGKVVQKDRNRCHTLTKAEVKRGGNVTYIEYNPKYSVYKDGNIYWSCQNGRKPSYFTKREKTSDYLVYRYEKDPQITLINTYYSTYYFYRGEIFRKVGDSGKPSVYNVETIKVTSADSFNRKPILLALGTQ